MMKRSFCPWSISTKIPRATKTRYFLHPGEVVYRNKNVFTDVSGLTLGDFNKKFERFMGNQVREMLLYAGDPRYLLYGTDWPICNMNSYLNFMRDLKLPHASMDKIMWKNAAELFKIDLGITAEVEEKMPMIPGTAGALQTVNTIS